MKDVFGAQKGGGPFESGGKRERAFGFDKALSLLKKHDPQLFEDGYAWLRANASECLPELLSAFRDEDPALRSSLLALIAEASSSDAFDLFVASLRGEESLRFAAIRGLHLLGTAEARTALWEARRLEFSGAGETQRFREELARVTGKPF